jgi:D-sedoheptulose 7-phosphate isomerase
MKYKQLFETFRRSHNEVINSLHSIDTELELAVDKCVEAFSKGGKIIFCGNGGSAADCQHLAAEFVGRFINDRPALPAIALTTDSSILTAVGNDYGFDQIFSRQLEALANKDDVLITISTSGNSRNIINALATGKNLKCFNILMSGREGGDAKKIADLSLIVKSDVTAHIQESHIFLGHLLCKCVEQKLNYE